MIVMKSSWPTEPMLAPLILPFQITAAIFAVLWCVGALLLSTPKRISLLSLASALLFIPSCIGVMAIVDLQRYGRFDYATASAIPRVAYIQLPADAANITLYRTGAGHWAKFTIDTPSLRSWVDKRRSLRPDLNKSRDENEWAFKDERSQHADRLRLNQENFGSRFPNTGWTYDPSMLELRVTVSDRGGGYTLWHVPSTGDTYIRAGYW